ncbi:MAG: ATP-dependent DNA helicase [Elusimicrobiota bacterium]
MQPNPEQKKAIEHHRGPLLIVAGAGTGKTTVIANRIAYLISQKKAKPEEILALTFTEKAATEMQERVDMLVPYGFADVWISTFHSFGNSVLEDDGLFLGLTTDFKVMAEPQQIVFFREHLFEFPMDKFRPLGNPLKHIESILFLFTRLKDEDVACEEYADYVQLLENVVRENPKDDALKEEFVIQKELSDIYKKYEELKIKAGVIDFSDQVWLTLKLFRDHPAVLKKYREKFKYILVDEFQDTNYSQFQLLKLLLNKEKNITVVGDDDQSIYKFRGAAISNILNFKRTYPNAKQVVLTKNYRSVQQILDTAYTLIKYNNPDRLEVKNKINKKLISVRKHKNSRTQELKNVVSHHHFDTVSAEADFVAEKIEEFICVNPRSNPRESALLYKDFAILVRSNNDAEPFIKSLNMKDIPWHFSGGSGLYTRQEIKVLISFLKVIAEPADNVALFYLAASDVYNMPMADLTIYMNTATQQKNALYKMLSSADIQDISNIGIQIARKIIDDIKKYIELSRELSTGQVLYKFIQETGWLKKLVEEKTGEKNEQVSNIALFFEIIKKFAEISQHDKLQFFIQHLTTLIDAGSNPATAEPNTETDAVNILTIHKAKGLEFPVVFLVAAVQGKFPVRRRQEHIAIPESLIKDILPSGDFHLQEERRLFYVGLTRAKQQLYITSAGDYGGARERKISQFVYETLSLPATKIAAQKLQPIEALKKNAVVENVKIKTRLTYTTPLILSHFQIDDYLTCPLKYKYIHILKIPVMANHTIVYGNAMHKTIQFYYKRKITKKLVTLEELLKKFEANWQSAGFLSREHEEQRLETGRETIRNFFYREQKTKIVPKYIEKKFKFNSEGNIIIGRFDRVDITKKGAIIIDFKTSDISDKQEADERAKKSTQLAIYALAWNALYGVLPQKVELHFVETGVVGSTAPDEKMMNRIKEIINITAAGIQAEKFEPAPQYRSCNYCPFNTICPNVKKTGSSKSA